MSTPRTLTCTTSAQCTGGPSDTCQTSGVQAGQQCATLSVDRTILYECNEAVTVTVNDPKRAGTGQVQVLAASDSDARQFSTGKITALHPRPDFKRSILQAFTEGIAPKPETTFGNVKADVLQRFVPGYERADFVDIIENSDWPE